MGEVSLTHVIFEDEAMSEIVDQVTVALTENQILAAIVIAAVLVPATILVHGYIRKRRERREIDEEIPF